MAVGDYEKVSVNCGAVDLGQIDLLVEQGVYSNRSDFFRTAIRAQLKTHADFINQKMVERTISLGIMSITREDLAEYVLNGNKMSVEIIGLVTLADDISAELALSAIEKLKVKGILRCSREIKAALGSRIEN